MRDKFLFLICQPQKTQTYRNMRVWVHTVIITISGFVSLIYATSIIPIIQQAIVSLNEHGFLLFFKDAPWLQMVLLIPPGVFHLVVAIFCISSSLASFDALKDRILNSSPLKPS